MQPTDSNKFTDPAWDAIVKSQEVSRRYQHQYLEVEHLAIALLEQEGLANKILNRAQVLPEKLLQQLSNFAQQRPKAPKVSELYLGRGLDLMLDKAEAARAERDDKYISVEHLLLALAEDDRIGRRAFKASSKEPRTPFDKQQLEAAIEATRGSAKVQDENPESQYDVLEKYGRDLTEHAKAGRLDPVIGRDDEIRRVIQVLSRRRKNNPVLIGEPGVGKTAIAEGLAQRIINGDVPESLKNRQLISLDMGSLIAGAKFRGQFEERLRSVLREVTASDGQIVLFIDELHTVIGTGAGQGTMDASNLLKPMLARGELRCIGATTVEEYRKYIEKDAALERRFQQIAVVEPRVENTISILRGLKERYEVHHGVKILDSALVAAATLSDRYISDRFLPDKAIDLVDEAAAKLKMEITSKPTELENVERRLMQLEMEKLSLEGEGEVTSSRGDSRIAPTQERLQGINVEISSLKEKQEKLNSQWQSQKELLDDINGLKEKEDQIRLQIEQAERKYDLERAAKLKYGKLEGLQRDRETKETKLKELQAQGATLLRQQVTESDIAEIVAKWTGIPVNRLLESERQKLLQLESYLHQRVIGQHEAVSSVAAAIRRARAGMKDPSRPIGSFLFMGPTGVGKTELARALAEAMFDSEDAIVRIDMSEYMEKHSVSRLVGAPPGYVGYDAGGQLTEAIRRQPYSTVLFDEVEKAHPDVFNILLQVLDEGRITDSQGRTVDFRNTVIIMTSNIGSDRILDLAGDDSKYEEMRKWVMQELRSRFRPEFLNRVDDPIIFHALSRSELREIVGIQVKRLEKLLADQKISLQLMPTAQEFIVEVGYDPNYGARPLKRAIQQKLENPIANLLLEEKFVAGDTIYIYEGDGNLEFSAELPEIVGEPSEVKEKKSDRSAPILENNPSSEDAPNENPDSDPWSGVSEPVRASGDDRSFPITGDTIEVKSKRL
ncbi:MAG: ATP-dependent chaperone ClpB [Oscillatoria sp. SIO1A7]|nr:ATP-dependent chaperone ClpB [Oscillatoria sp. SIO1A7]